MRAVVAALGLALLPLMASAQTLKPGVAAPKIEVQAWTKGEAITEFKKDHTYVVEFWATWCGPCRTSIPHLSKLQKQYGDKVTIIGVSVWERGDDIVGLVKNFQMNSGLEMDYTVAVDTAGGTMAKTWMEAANQRGIPAAFIVKNGVVQWIGHPMGMDEPLKQVVDGSFDLQASVKQFEAEMEAERKQEEVMAAVNAATAKAATDWQGALVDLGKIEAGPDLVPMVSSRRLMIIQQYSEENFMAAFEAELAKADNTNTVFSFLSGAANRRGGALDSTIAAAQKAVETYEKEDRAIAAYYGAVALNSKQKTQEAIAMLDKGLKALGARTEDNGPLMDALTNLRKQLAGG